MDKNEKLSLKSGSSQGTQQSGYFIPIAQAGGAENESDMLEVLRVLYLHKWLIVAVIFITTSISVIYALTVTPIYRAKILLAPVNAESSRGGLSVLSGQLSGLAAITGIDFGGRGGSSNTNIVIAILTSRVFLKQFISKYNLMPLLYDEQWDSSKKEWKSKDKKLIPNMWNAVKLFNEILTVNVNNKKRLVTLSIDWKDSKLAALWANKLVDQVNQRLKMDAIRDSNRNLEYLREQLAKTDVVAVQQAMFGLIEAEMKNAMLANVNKEYAFKVIDPAVEPGEKIKPIRRNIVGLGLFFGIVISIGIVFILNYFRLRRNEE